MKRDRKFGEQSTCRFKIGIGSLTKIDQSTQKSQKKKKKDEWAPI